MKPSGLMAAIVQTFSMDGQQFTKGEVLNFRINPDKSNTIWDDRRIVKNVPGTLFMVVAPNAGAKYNRKTKHKKPTNK